jgi:hypothetical protein
MASDDLLDIVHQDRVTESELLDAPRDLPNLCIRSACRQSSLRPAPLKAPLRQMPQRKPMQRIGATTNIEVI